MQRFDLAIVGAGVLGLGHAYHAARRGLSVVVLERNEAAQGASVRNFGMLAIVAQAPGQELESAQTALRHWQEIAAGAGVSLRQAGCVFVAQVPEELRVLQDCAARYPQRFEMLAHPELEQRGVPTPGANVLGGLWSSDAWKVDQRAAMSRIAAWLARRHGVDIRFGADVTGVGGGRVVTSQGEIGAGQVIICGGDEFEALFPQAFQSSGVSRCCLQMLRTAPQPRAWRLAPFLLGGLSVTRYSAFDDCAGLDELRAWQDAQRAEYMAQGIHVVAAQEDDGSVTIGDSHHYGVGPDAVPDPAVEGLVMNELATMLSLPDPEIVQRWTGRYAHLPGASDLILSPEPGVEAVTVTNGQGMTHGLAVAERMIGRLYA